MHYGFTEEELDCITNYGIKYRMGLGGEAGDADGLFLIRFFPMVSQLQGLYYTDDTENKQ
jgi:hypothetical protein